jgi:hypothetical protein
MQVGMLPCPTLVGGRNSEWLISILPLLVSKELLGPREGLSPHARRDETETRDAGFANGRV